MEKVSLMENDEICERIGKFDEKDFKEKYELQQLVYYDMYTEKQIKEVLSKYEEDKIPEDKKVNVVAIMLEAYNDFSVFKDEIPFTEDIYKGWHEIEDDSIHGRLVTTVFGGGTIETERAFLTGMQTHPSYRKPTNSFVWYFKKLLYFCHPKTH